MSKKKEARRAARAALEEKQMKRAIKVLTIAVAVLIVISLIAFTLLGNVA